MSGTDGAPIVTGPVEDQLEERELIDYQGYKTDLLQWLTHIGKDPEQVEGYAQATVRQVSYKVDQFYRWRWIKEGYTTAVTPDDADEYIKSLLYSDTEYSTGHKATTQKCIKRLFKWRRHELGEDIDWEPQHSFSPQASQPRDYLTVEERRQMREADLEYGSVPAYTALSPEERSEWKAYLAQRLEKPKAEVSPADFAQANSWKIPSLVWTSLDAGLRPIEVGRATIEWVDVQNKSSPNS